VLTHPQLAGRWTPIGAGDREVEVLPPPAKHAGFGPVLGAVAKLGEHTGAVLAEFGVADALARRFRAGQAKPVRQFRAGQVHGETL
jgi:crotonobetainyl-CoA:carnitine CoA-transferase CaiB-like acyl-CoA transferase